MNDVCIMIFQYSVRSSSFLGCFLETDQSKTSFRSMYVRQWMRLLPSEESLSCAANTTFGLKDKRNNVYLNYLLQEKKDPTSTPCNW